MKTKLFITVLILISATMLFSQTITGIKAEQNNKEISISYNITGTKSGDKFDVKIYCSTDGGSNWGYPLKYISGDVGKNVSGGYNKKINWRVTDERDKLEGNKIRFKISAIQQNITPADMVFVKGGTFKMGSNDGDSDEKPIHGVTVSDFYIGKYEVTNEEFCKFLNAYGSDKVKSGTYAGKTMIYASKVSWGVYKSGNTWYPGSGYAKHPVINVTWYGANEYCKWAGGRLPTEAEWEYAAGGGQNSPLGKGVQGDVILQKWAGTNSESSLGSYAWYDGNSGDKTHQVGTKSPNSLGIYDMSGNVYEWCSDWYSSSYYSNSPQYNPQGPSSGSRRVRRGGSWSSNANYCRVAFRYSLNPANYSIDIGFRIIRAP